MREYCKRQGFKKSAEIADQIDRVLCYLYGESETGKWEEYIEKGIDGISEVGETRLGSYDLLRGVVSNRGFCIACGRSIDCASCRFGRLTGGCIGYDTLYREFLRMYRVESLRSMI